MDYRGFLIQARLVANDSAVGTFSNPNSDPAYQTQCSNDVSFVHNMIVEHIVEFANFYRQLLHTLTIRKKRTQLLCGLHLLQEVVILLLGNSCNLVTRYHVMHHTF